MKMSALTPTKLARKGTHGGWTHTNLLCSLRARQAALEQGAEDAGFNLGPVQPRGFGEQLQFVGFKAQRGGVIEQATVEPVDVLESDIAALMHGREQLTAALLEHGRVSQRTGHHAREQLARQQPDVLGEHAEHQPIEKVRDGLRIVLARAVLARGE